MQEKTRPRNCLCVLMSNLIPDSSILQSLLNKCHVFVDFLFSPAIHMRKNLKVLQEKKDITGSKYYMKELVGECTTKNEVAKKKVWFFFYFLFYSFPTVFNSYGWEKINKLISLSE